MDGLRPMPHRPGVHDVILESGREHTLLRRHPWLFSGSVERIEGTPEPGAFVRVLSAAGDTLGFGHYSPASTIRVRLLHFGAGGRDEDLEPRLDAALARRDDPALAGDSEALRLVNAEGDGLPGLTVDRYGDALVVRFGSVGMERRRERIAAALRKRTGAALGFERGDGAAARREGFAQRDGPLWGAPPVAPVWIRERERRYAVDLVHGQKTGFYLDQRDARDRVQALAAGRHVLDLFAYTGGFAAAAARGGAARVTLVESSAGALELAERNLAANAPAVPARLLREDAFRHLRGSGSGYDLVVIDPPALARRRSDVPRATRAHKDLLLHACRRLGEGGLVLAFTCSHQVGPELHRKIAAAAALDAGRPLRWLGELGAPADHPVCVSHPEGRYLHGLLLGA